MAHEVWTAGDVYETFVGRWSRPVADALLSWLEVPDDRAWLDLGCGTGVLTAAVLSTARPAAVVGVDPAEPFLAHARRGVAGDRCAFVAGDAQALPFADDGFGAVVSGLAVNFVPVPHRAVAEAVRVAATGATVAAYVWDYAAGMTMLRHFWDVATGLDPDAAHLDEGRRFPLCQPEPLRDLWRDAGLADVTVRSIDVPTVFADFTDFWTPFLGGQGPAPGYVASLSGQRRQDLRDQLESRLAADSPGAPIELTARAWAVRGTVR